jgi:hypothetical protein
MMKINNQTERTNAFDEAQLLRYKALSNELTEVERQRLMILAEAMQEYDSKPVGSKHRKHAKTRKPNGKFEPNPISKEKACSYPYCYEPIFSDSKCVKHFNMEREVYRQKLEEIRNARVVKIITPEIPEMPQRIIQLKAGETR